MNALCILGTRALVQASKLEIISNNLANTDTPGFKADHLSLNLTKPVSGAGPVRPDDLSPRVRYFTDFSSGQLRATGNPTDFALEGDGFFVVRTPAGEQYTRKGNFALSKEGLLTTQEGLPVLGEGGLITLAGGDISADEQGNIYLGGEQAAKLKIVNIADRSKLEKTGDCLFRVRDGAAPEPATAVSVRQGVLECSNVEMIRTMTEMIETLRGYEAYQKMIQCLDDNNSKSVNEVGRIS